MPTMWLDGKRAAATVVGNSRSWSSVSALTPFSLRIAAIMTVTSSVDEIAKSSGGASVSPGVNRGQWRPAETSAPVIGEPD